MKGSHEFGGYFKRYWATRLDRMGGNSDLPVVFHSMLGALEDTAVNPPRAFLPKHVRETQSLVKPLLVKKTKEILRRGKFRKFTGKLVKR